MSYVLWSYGVTVVAAVILAAGLARRLSRQVSAPLPAAIEPTYREGSPSWRVQQQRAEDRRRAALLPPLVPVPFPEPAAVLPEPTADDIAREVEELERQLARVTAPEVAGATIVHWESPPTYVQAELNHSGAEQWGDLFDQMRTEERTIYNAQMVIDHDAHKEVERGFLSELDRAVNEVLARLAAANDAAEQRALYWEASAARRGTFVDAPTGAYPVLQPV